MKEIVKTAIIGAGRWGQVMIAAWQKNPNVSIEAVCDLNGDQAQTVADKHNIPRSFSDIDEMFRTADIDAVGIATPDFAHRDPVVISLEHGKHVLVQKPMATNVADCQAMVKAQESSGAHLMVDFQHRWGIGYREARVAVSQESFGNPVHGRIRMSNKQSVPLEMLSWSGQSNVLWFIGTHTLDLLRYILGSEPVKVFAASESNILRAKGPDTEDFFQSMIQFDNGAWIQMENSWVLPAGGSSTNETDMIIYGANESVEVKQSPTDLVVKSTEVGTEVPDGARADITARHVSINHFIDCIREGVAPSVTGYDGLMNTATLVAIEKSAKTGQPVLIEEVLS